MLPTVEPWIQFCGVDQSLASEIRDSLRRAGVPQVAAGADYPALFGILCFSGIDLILLQRLHELRERPRSRVLALAASLEALAGGAEWRLLNAGASEVLPWQGAETAERIRAKLERWSTVESLADLAARRESMAGESPA